MPEPYPEPSPPPQPVPVPEPTPEPSEPPGPAQSRAGPVPSPPPQAEIAPDGQGRPSLRRSLAKCAFDSFRSSSALAVAATPASGDVSSRKQEVDARLQRVQAKIAWAEQRERELAAEIASVNSDIQPSRRGRRRHHQLAPLERDLELHKAKLDRLTELYRLQTTASSSSSASTRR